MNYFTKKLLGYDIFSSGSLGFEIFFEKCVKPSGPYPYVLNRRSFNRKKAEENFSILINLLSLILRKVHGLFFLFFLFYVKMSGVLYTEQVITL